MNHILSRDRDKRCKKAHSFNSHCFLRNKKSSSVTIERICEDIGNLVHCFVKEAQRLGLFNECLCRTDFNAA